MRTFFWLTAVTLVAAAVAVTALTDYADRHPSSTLGRGLARMALAWSGAQTSKPDAPLQEAEETGANPDNASLPIIDLGMEKDDSLLRELKIISELAKEPEEIVVGPKPVEDVSNFATAQADEFTPKKMPPAEEEEERFVIPVEGRLPQEFTSDLDIPINSKSFNVECEGCPCCGVFGAMFDYLGCWLKGFFGAEAEIEIEIGKSDGPGFAHLNRKGYQEFLFCPSACGTTCPPCSGEQRVYDVLMLMSCPRGLPCGFERVGVDFEGCCPFVTHQFQAPCQSAMVWAPVHSLQPNGAVAVTGYVYMQPPADVVFQHGIPCPRPIVQAGFVVPQPFPNPVACQPVMPACWAPAPHMCPSGAEWPQHRITIAPCAAPMPPRAAVACSPCCTESKCSTALSKTVSVDFNDQPLAEVLEQFRELTGLNIVHDKPALDDEGIGMDQPVTLKLKDVPAGVALKWTLNHCRLGFKIEDDLVVVTTAKKPVADERVITQVHPVGSAVECPQDGEMLVHLIHRAIAPQTWDVNGGSGRIDWRPQQRAILVANTPERQEEVSRLIQALSEVVGQGDQAASCSPPCPPCPPCLPPVGMVVPPPPSTGLAASCPAPPAIRAAAGCTPGAPVCRDNCCDKNCCDADGCWAPRVQLTTADGQVVEIHLKITKPKGGGLRPASVEILGGGESLAPVPPAAHPEDLPPPEFPDGLPVDEPAIPNPTSHADPVKRAREVLIVSDDLRSVLADWERIWFIDQPSRLAPRFQESNFTTLQPGLPWFVFVHPPF
jgi:hypothetical protein